MLWFQVCGRSWYCSRKWVWNLRTKLSCMVSGKVIVTMVLQQELDIGSTMFYAILT